MALSIKRQVLKWQNILGIFTVQNSNFIDNCTKCSGDYITICIELNIILHILHQNFTHFFLDCIYLYFPVSSEAK